MKYKAKTLDGKEIEGNYVIYEGLNMVLVAKTESGTTRTNVQPSSLEEVEE